MNYKIYFPFLLALIFFSKILTAQKVKYPLMYKENVIWGALINEQPFGWMYNNTVIKENNDIVNYYFKEIETLEDYNGNKLSEKQINGYLEKTPLEADTQLIIDPITLTERFEVFERNFCRDNVFIRPFQEWYMNNETGQLIVKIPFVYILETRYDENNNFIAEVPILKSPLKPSLSINEEEVSRSSMQWSSEYIVTPMKHKKGRMATFKSYNYENLFDVITKYHRNLKYKSKDGKDQFENLDQAMHILADTAEVFDPTTLKSRFEVLTPQTIYGITSYRIKQDFQFDKRTGKWTSQIKAIMPIQAISIDGKNPELIPNETFWIELN